MSELEKEFEEYLRQLESKPWVSNYLPARYIQLIKDLKQERDAALDKITLLEGAINILRE